MGPHHHGGHGGHNHGGHPVHGHGHSHGHHGSYRHKVHQRGWKGWRRRRWSRRHNCWMYWCPAETCWYESTPTCFVPCDDETDETTED